MSVKDVEAAGIRQMDTIRRKHEREAGRLETMHQKRKSELSEAQEAELVDLRTEHQKSLTEQVEKKEKILNDIRKNLDETKKMTDREIAQVKETSEKTKAYETTKLGSDRDRIKDEHNLYLEELNYRFSEDSKKVNDEGRERVEKVKTLKQGELVDKEGYFKKKLHDQTDNYTTRINREGTEYRKIKNDQDRQFKSERMGANQRQQLEVAKLTDHHNKTIESRDRTFRKGIKEQDQMFEKKYVQTLGHHNENLERLKERNDQVVNQMKDQLGKAINTSPTKKDDPFYEFTELKPKLTNTPDGIKIEVPVAEHAKQDVTLTLNNKEAIINYSRRHNDVRKSETITSKMQKVESFSTRLMTEHVLNPKTVKSSYADGVMTYTVSKA